jgi:aspartate kinase
MIVMKFGGGCLKDAEDFVRAAEAVGRGPGRRAVVVSAASGVTDMLLEAGRRAELGEGAVDGDLRALEGRHRSLCAALAGDPRSRTETLAGIEAGLKRVRRLLYGISYTAEMTPAARSHLVSYGERLSALILAAVLRARGVPARRFESDRIGMVTDETVEDATVDPAAFRTNLRSALRPVRPGGLVPVITGFFGITPRGRVATFGRNGTDYSAAVVARALDADRLEIWKDVEGFMSADPKVVPGARRIGRLSPYEAAELSYFGARILHPRTLEPLEGGSTTVVIKDLFHPDRPGTRVLPGGEPRGRVIKSVTSNPNVALLRIHGPGVGYKPGVIALIGRRLAERNINIYSVITSQTCINLLLDRKDAGPSREALGPERGGVIERLDLEDDVALIAAVGEGLRRTKGLAARIFSAVWREGINVEMISTGASEVASYFIVKRPEANRAVRALHREFFGRVGGAGRERQG